MRRISKALNSSVVLLLNLALLLSPKGNLLAAETGIIDLCTLTLATLVRDAKSHTKGFGTLNAEEVKLLRDHLGQVHTILDNVTRYREQGRIREGANSDSDIEKHVNERFKTLVEKYYKDSLLPFYFKNPASIEPQDVEALGRVLLAEVNFHGIAEVKDSRLSADPVTNPVAHANKMASVPFESNKIVTLSRRLEKVLDQHKAAQETNKLGADPKFAAWVTQLKLFLDRTSRPATP